MYSLSLSNTSDHLVTLCHVADDFSFCAVAEANHKDPETFSPGSGLRRLLAEAVGSLPAGMPAAALPSGAAHSVGELLKKWHAEALPDNSEKYA